MMTQYNVIIIIIIDYLNLIVVVVIVTHLDLEADSVLKTFVVVVVFIVDV